MVSEQAVVSIIRYIRVENTFQSSHVPSYGVFRDKKAVVS
jgi:hypothetical protein